MQQTETASQTTVADAAHHEPVLSHGRARRLYMIIGGLALALLLFYGIFELFTTGRETTDDAQVAADVVPVSARIGGQVASVPVVENQFVRKGDVIALIDPSDAQVKLAQSEGDLETARAQAAAADARVTLASASARGGLAAAQAAVRGSHETVQSSGDAIAEARAAVAAAEANARKGELDNRRAEELGAKGDISRAQVDAAHAANETARAALMQARARLDSTRNARQLAEANVQQAEGKLEQTGPVGAQVAAAAADAALAHAKVKSAQAALQAAQLALSYTRITAPADGIAAKLSVHPGNVVSAGQPIVQLVPLHTYVVANFKETQVKSMRPGQRAEIRVDSLGGKTFEGRVDSLSGGTGSAFALLPPDNASGNFVKIVQRVPVRVSWSGPPSNVAAAGSSAEVTVFTK
jgi:membrane fusion protein, multidrug efflux system